MDKTLAYDKAISFRWHDEDGRMHVDRSNLTRVQVAPYRGAEIPGWESLKLDPEKIYYGYRSADELSDPETIKSVIGIPIQLNHHLDYPSAPAKDTRVGSTGDLAQFDGTYLSNSLHIQDEDACRRIRDGSMRQLSLAYHYDPDFNSSGEYKGQKYDFTMRNIRGQHLALVEEGRAGDSCVVEDSAIQLGEKSKMDEDKKTPDVGKDGDPAVEKAEIKIAEAMKMLADLLGGLHKTNEMGEIVDITEDEDKNAKIKELAEKFAELGASPEAVKKLTDSLQDLAYLPDENQAKAGAEDEDGETDELDEMARDALKACGFDDESPEFQRAFAEGVKYGEKKEKEEPKKLDREHEREGEERYLAQDAKLKALEKKLEARDAYDECKSILGNVRCAFDSAEQVYLAALKAKGVSTKNIKPEMAKAIFYGFMAGSKSVAKSSEKLAQDSKIDDQTCDLAKGINVRI